MDIGDLAESIKERLGVDREVVDDEEEASIRSSKVVRGDLCDARELRDRLVDEYCGCDLEEVFGCSLVENGYGEFFHKEEVVDSCLCCPSCSVEDVLCDLKLVYGIGVSRERELKEEGYESIRELIDHDRWGGRARETLEKFDSGGLDSGLDVISRWKSSSDPLFLKYSGFYDVGDFGILDIETMGLGAQPVILIGLGLPMDGCIEFHQFLLKDFDQELAALKSFYDKIRDRKAVLTFNGKSFDVPFLERRFSFYGEDWSLDQSHFDLYHFSKRAFGDELPNYKLNTIEREVLGIERDIDVPSSMVPEFYKTYREEDNPGPLIPILRHNKQDILTLNSLLSELKEELVDE
ncbi:MAG: putative exonuclease containing RNaseH-like domain [Candidatus Methanohalarchaeum thermophilum]|uniref:Exonuclease containing RNaseH-like domain n=1 Tax=Methanohalarchaeum thermophilum TaxID=1903181 RepID=A0A1Q6DWL3_METT1|nr:MAG: putative exonuclease containing RNaseH-like domain [Candidatus Methanohalarchaeum thermophilum]